jgi:hypothetical protein
MSNPSRAEAPAPVFLICSERSGSNLIASIMGAHPQVYAHPPYHLGRDLLGPLQESMPDGAGAEAWQVLTDHAIAKVRRYRDEAEAQRLAGFMANCAGPDAGAVARFVWQEMPQDAHGKVAFVKENNIHHLFPLLLTAFPRAKFVFQVRDPRDYLASAKARRKVWLGNKFGSLRQALTVWHADQQAGLAALGQLGPERVFTLRYEDLVSDAEAQLKALCAFCDLPFDAAMLSYHESEDAAKLAQTTGARANLAKPLMTGNFRKYRKSLSRGEIRITEAWLGGLMERFGYPLEYPRRTPPSVWHSLRPQLTEPFERLVNGEVAPFYKVGHKRLWHALDRVRTPLFPMLEEGPRKGTGESQ